MLVKGKKNLTFSFWNLMSPNKLPKNENLLEKRRIKPARAIEKPIKIKDLPNSINYLVFRLLS